MVRILQFAADMGKNSGVLLMISHTVYVVPWLLPDGEVVLLRNLSPAQAASTILNLILLALQVFLSPRPAFVVCLPVDRGTRQDPVASRPQHTVNFDQENVVCTS